jgi:hypothetical protein
MPYNDGMNQPDTEGEDVESKIRRLLEVAEFPTGTTVRPTTVHNRTLSKGADALSGVSKTKPGVQVRISLAAENGPARPRIGQRLNILSRRAASKADPRYVRQMDTDTKPTGREASTRPRPGPSERRRTHRSESHAG